MAKRRKNSTALFEVMAAHRARQQPGSATSAAPPPTTKSFAPPPGQLQMSRPPRPSLLSIGRQWLAGMLERKLNDVEASAPIAAAPLDPSDPTAGMTAESLSARSVTAHPPLAEPTIAAAPAQPIPTRPAPEPVRETTAARSPTSPAAAADMDPARPAERIALKPSNEVAFDRDKHQITLKVRFTTAVIAVAALLVVIGLGFILGSRSGSVPPTKPAAKKPDATTNRPAAGNLAGEARTAGGHVGAETDGVAGVQSNGPLDITQVVPSGAFEDAPNLPGGGVRRTPALNYCVIASYHPDFQDLALEVSEFLNAQGIPNTIEIGSSKIRGSQTGWYLIIGTRGFAPRYGETPAYDQYMQAIHAAAAKYPNKSKFGRVQTYGVKWSDSANNAAANGR